MLCKTLEISTFISNLIRRRYINKTDKSERELGMTFQFRMKNLTEPEKVSELIAFINKKIFLMY